MRDFGTSVGVVIRTRKRPHFVARALRSVAAQTHDDWRVVLVNDGGARAPLDALIDSLATGDGKGFPRERLLTEHLPKSIGRSAAFNHGLARLDTGFVACLDDDDSWQPDFMQGLLAFHARIGALVPDLGGVMAMVTAIREEVIHHPDGREEIVELGEDGLANAFRRRDFLVNPVAYATYRHDLYPVQWLLKREAVVQAGGFPAEFDVMEDRAFMTRFLQHWQLAVLDKPLARHHRRVSRTADTGRTASMNTLDNPSYDWRLFADLARIGIHSPSGTGPDLATLVRAVASTVVREINDETSAIWHKLDGEARRLRERIEALGSMSGAQPTADQLETAPERIGYALWQALDGQEIGHAIDPAAGFAGRFSLSQGFTLPGQLILASAALRRFDIQLPETRDWSAVEFSLDGLAPPGNGLVCEAIIGSAEGFLFETALSLWQKKGFGSGEHRFIATHVHSCPPMSRVHLRRWFSAAELAQGSDAKLSIILPKAARNFRFCLHDLVISRQ
ncbi:MAG: glycosyltransferase family 2 protein [Pararhodobacter sp.]|nr:glycosyltransferase family 2 protein [Pararhodobacter sp.]